MSDSIETHEYPADYPRNGTFGELLEWHLKWGTRPFCSTTCQSENTPWAKSDFSALVHRDSATEETAKKNITNWTKAGKLPDERTPERVGRIYQELFGQDEALKHWKRDLAKAYLRGLRSQAARIAKREIEAGTVPLPTTHFMGRDSELDALAEALASSSATKILIQGGPSIGKTELIKAIAHHPQVVARFGERRCFVPLETATSAVEMQHAIIRGLGCDLKSGFRAALAAVGGRPILLLLDSLETPWDPIGERLGVEEVLANLCRIEGVSILASFRGKELVGNIRWRPHDVTALSLENAALLFGNIAGDWVTLDDNLTKFLAELEGNPLAIQLVARRAYGRTDLSSLWGAWEAMGTDLASHPDFAAEKLTSLAYSIELSLRSERMTPLSMQLFRMLQYASLGVHPQDLPVLLRSEDAFDAEERLYRVGLAYYNFLGRLEIPNPIRQHAIRHYGLDEAEFEALFDRMCEIAAPISK